ncbi:MAG: hypothetical protein LBH00_12760 [Planctomycetaceae bacterium]|nr:hypothetical protein [Planctomycetaceae bacterium]
MAAIFHRRISVSCIAAALLTAVVIVYSPSRSHTENNHNGSEPPAAEPLILEGRLHQFSPDDK